MKLLRLQSSLKLENRKVERQFLLIPIFFHALFCLSLLQYRSKNCISFIWLSEEEKQ